jgi:hypothetical protein
LVSSCLADLAAFEQARLEFNGYARKFIFRQFEHDIREILRTVEISKDKANLSNLFIVIRPRRTFAVWLRLKKVHHFVF